MLRGWRDTEGGTSQSWDGHTDSAAVSAHVGPVFMAMLSHATVAVGYLERPQCESCQIPVQVFLREWIDGNTRNVSSASKI